MSIYDVSGYKINVAAIFVDIRNFGAAGDGTTNDAPAIQAALDSCKATGGTVYFPPGTYNVNAPIRFYSNQHLLFDMKATMKGGTSSVNGLLVGYVETGVGGYDGLQNVIIEGGTFERGSASSSSTLIAFAHAKNVVVKGAKLKSAPAWHDIEFNSTMHGIIDSCCFDGTSKTNSNGCLVQLDMFSTSNYPWDNGGTSDSAKCYDIEIKNCLFENCTAAPYIGSHSNSGSDCRIHDCTFIGNTSTRGAIQFDTLANLDVFENTFTDCTNGISFSGTGAASCSVHDNRFTGATMAISPAITVAYNNWINETFAE